MWCCEWVVRGAARACGVEMVESWRRVGRRAGGAGGARTAIASVGEGIRLYPSHEN